MNTMALIHAQRTKHAHIQTQNTSHIFNTNPVQSSSTTKTFILMRVVTYKI